MQPQWHASSHGIAVTVYTMINKDRTVVVGLSYTTLLQVTVALWIARMFLSHSVPTLPWITGKFLQQFNIFCNRDWIKWLKSDSHNNNSCYCNSAQVVHGLIITIFHEMTVTSVEFGNCIEYYSHVVDWLIFNVTHNKHTCTQWR